MRRRLVLATVVAALGPAAAAHAATTVGSDLTKTPAATPPCGTACTAFTGDNTSGAPSAVAPFDGVVVRWRVRSGSAATGLALRALRSAGTGSYTGVQSSDPQSLAQAGTATFASRMAVKAGDILGLDDRTGGAKLAASATATAVYAFSPPLGAFAHIPSKQVNRELLVNADVERDVDGDGYGDETQDLCPGDASRHTTCLSNLSVSIRPEPAPLT